MKRNDHHIYTLLKAINAQFEMDQICDERGKSQKGCPLHERIRLALGGERFDEDGPAEGRPLSDSELWAFVYYFAARFREIYLEVWKYDSLTKTVPKGSMAPARAAAVITALLFISKGERESRRFAGLVRSLVDWEG